MIALQIRGILEQLRSGSKDVNVGVLCDRLMELSDRDPEKDSWIKDVREYLCLLLSDKFLGNDLVAQQAIKNLLRNL